MTEDPIICRCKGVKKSVILKAIHEQNARVQGDIQRITGASTGCGRCGVKVRRILAEELQDK